MKDNNKVNNFFNSNVSDYENKHYGKELRSFMTVRHSRVLDCIGKLNLQKGAKVLDAGCGPGYLLESLAERGLQVTGIDASENMLRRAREKLGSLTFEFPITLNLGSVEELPYKNESFDLVCSTGVIEYLETDTTMLKEIFRVLRPKGYLVLPVTNYWSPINCLEFLTEFTKRQKYFLHLFNIVWQRNHAPVLPRMFKVRRHKPNSLHISLAEANFILIDQLYFYFLPWPRPFDKLFPNSSKFIGQKLEHFGRSWLGPIAEGYLTISTKSNKSIYQEFRR